MEGIENSNTEQPKIVYFDLSGDKLEVIEEGVRRDAKDDEKKEIARQNAGKPPSDGMPRFEFAPAARVDEGEREPISAGAESGPVQLPEPETIPTPPDVRELTPENIKEWEYDAERNRYVLRSNSGRHEELEFKRGEGWVPVEGGGELPVPPERPGVPAGPEPERDVGRGGPIDELPERGPENLNALGKFDKRDYIGIRPKTLDEILDSPLDQQLFGELFEAVAPERKELLERMRQLGKLTRDERRIELTREERQFENHLRHEYTKLMKQWEGVKGQLTPAFLEELAARDEDLRLVLEQRGPQRIAQAYQQLLPHVAMRDRGRFYDFVHEMHLLHENRDTRAAKRYTKDVHALDAKVGIDPRDHDAFFGLDRENNSENRAKTIKGIRDQYREHYGRAGKAWDDLLGKFGAGTAWRARLALDKARRLELSTQGPEGWNVLTDINVNLNKITDYVAPVITKNRIVLEAMTRGSFTKESLNLPEEEGPKTHADIGADLTRMEQGMERSFAAFKRAYRAPGNRAWAAMNDDERRAARDTIWAPQERADVRKGQTGLGIWAFIRAFLGFDRFDRKREALALGV